METKSVQIKNYPAKRLISHAVCDAADLTLFCPLHSEPFLIRPAAPNQPREALANLRKLGREWACLASLNQNW